MASGGIGQAIGSDRGRAAAAPRTPSWRGASRSAPRAPSSHGVAGLALVAALCVLTGCKARPGTACKNEGALTCLSRTEGVLCVDGKNLAIRCGGPAGCTEAGRAGGGAARSGESPAGAGCDDAIAKVGDGCPVEGNLACASDGPGGPGHGELRCKGHAFVLATTCRGAAGCSTAGGKLRCDDAVAEVGDPCEEKDRVACASSGRALHRCDGTAYRLDSACGGPGGCKIEGAAVSCDHHLAAVGDPCHAEKTYACSTDRTALLRCARGHFEEQKRCAGTCAFNQREATTEFDCP